MYGPTPGERIASLRELSDQAGSFSAEKQERAAAQLAVHLQNEPDPLIRAEIVRVLGKLPTQTGRRSLQMALNDQEKAVRIAAIEGLGHQQNEESLRALSETLGTDTDIDVQLATAKALGSFKDVGATRALAVALDSRDPALQQRAIESLKSQSGQDYGGDLVAWREFARSGTPARRPTLVERFFPFY